MKEKLVFVADALRQYAKNDDADPVVPLTITGLQLISKYSPEIFEQCREGNEFVTELGKVAEEVRIAVKDTLRMEKITGRQRMGDPFKGDPQATAFSLFECTAAILREAWARNIIQDEEAHQDIFTYFENCGQWDAEDKTAVTDFYFITCANLAAGARQ